MADSFYDGAEVGVLTDNWTVVSGSGSYSTDKAYAGSKSIKGNLGTDFNVKHIVFGSPTACVVEGWLYDDGFTNAGGTTFYLPRQIGINANQSTTHYCYVTDDWHTSSKLRTVGWHKIKVSFDGTNIKYYIDDELLVTYGSSDLFTKVELMSSPSRTTNSYFDEIRVYLPSPVRKAISPTFRPALTQAGGIGIGEGKQVFRLSPSMGVEKV